MICDFTVAGFSEEAIGYLPRSFFLPGLLSVFVYKETLIYGKDRQGQAVYRNAETTSLLETVRCSSHVHSPSRMGLGVTRPCWSRIVHRSYKQPAPTDPI